MMELKITKEKVLEAAGKCSQVKETLKTLFPEVFEPEKAEVFTGVRRSTHFDTESLKLFGMGFLVQVRNSGDYNQRAFYISTYNGSIKWELKKDNQGILVLVPTKVKQ